MSEDNKVNEVIEGTAELVRIEPEDNALVSVIRGEMDMQIATAKRYPRSIRRFQQEALSLATLDQETAASCFYTLTRREKDGTNKLIQGPSVRMAEIIGSCWTNMSYGARILDVGDKFITAQGACFDMERNIRATVEIRRRITNRDGRRFSDDMIQVTANAACAIALREAILKVIPRAFIKPIYDAACETAIGKAKTMETRRAEMLAYFAKMGVDQARVLAAIGKHGIEDLTSEDLVALRGMATAIKDGEASVDELFPKPASAPTRKPMAEAVSEVLKGKENAPAPKLEAPAPTPAPQPSTRRPAIRLALWAGTPDGNPVEVEVLTTPGPDGSVTIREPNGSEHEAHESELLVGVPAKDPTNPEGRVMPEEAIKSPEALKTACLQATLANGHDEGQFKSVWSKIALAYPVTREGTGVKLTALRKEVLAAFIDDRINMRTGEVREA